LRGSDRTEQSAWHGVEVLILFALRGIYACFMLIPWK
jgi:hypothetical protein